MTNIPTHSKHTIFLFSIMLVLLLLLFSSACTQAQESPIESTETPFSLPTPKPTATAKPTETPAPTNTLVMTGMPTFVIVRSAVDLQVLSYVTYRASGLLYVAGVAVNRGTVPAGEVRIAVSLLDAKGNVAASASLTETHIWYVPPDGKYPFLVPMPTAPKEWKDVKIQFETKIYQADQLYQPYWNLKVDKVAGQPPKGGAYPNFGYSGSVTNLGNKPARMVQVVAIAYDAGGKVLDVSSVYIEFEYLNPGQDAPFQLYFQNLKTAPARYEMLAEGHLAN